PGGQQLPYGLAALDLLTTDGPGPRRPPGAASTTPARGSRALGGPGALPHSSTRATAQHATPSPRPRAPRPSARPALTLTGAPTTAPRRASISRLWAAR